MNSIRTQWTDQTPSRFGMPIDGSTYGMTCIDATFALAATRDRHVAGDVRLVKGAFPGTSAWRPPNC